MLKSGTKVIEIEPLEPTVERFNQFKEYSNNLRMQIDARGELARIRAIAKIIKAYPELFEMIGYDGAFKADKIKERAERIVKENEIEIEEANAIVVKQFQQRIALIASEDKEVAAALFFPELNYPCTKESITVAIEVLKNTFDKSKVTKNDLKLLSEDDFWNNVEWKGVADYANTFRELYQ